MAKLTVTDRNLLRDEIVRRLNDELPSKEEILKKAIKEEGISKQIVAIDSICEDIKVAELQLEVLKKKRNNAIINLESYVGFNKYNGSWKSYDMVRVNTFLVEKYSKQLPSLREIETALLLAQGGDDMNALMNSVIEQLKNR